VQTLDLRDILDAQDEVAVDGILVVAADGRVIWSNRRYADLWSVPPGLIENGADGALLEHVAGLLRDGEGFRERVAELYRDGEEASRDELELLDGRMVERFSGPLRNRDGSLFGRVWFFRDITTFKQTERTLRERLEHLQAVYELAGAVDRAESVEEITRAAFDSLERLLGADRVALLLADGDDRLRFRAWRGLSDAYRAAIEARSPVLPHLGNPDAISIPDVFEDPSFADLLEVVAREGLRGYAFIPLVHGDRLTGRLVLYYEGRRELSGAELRLCRALGSHIAFAVARRQAEEALRLSRDELAVILGGVTDGITVQDPSGRLVYANDAAARLLGAGSALELTQGDPAALMPSFEVFGEDGNPLPIAEFPGRLALGGQTPKERVLRWRAVATGEDRWSIVTATPVFGAGGEVRLAINIFRDITVRKREEERVAFLAEAGDVLNRSLDYAETLREVARLAVPRIADWCVVYMRDGETIERLAVEHHAGRGEEVGELLARFPLDAGATSGVPQVMRSGEPLLLQHADSETLARDASRADELARELEELNVRSSMTVPLSAPGGAFGAISFVSTESGRRFDDTDLELALELARRASVAVENARLYREAERSFAMLDALFASSPVGLAQFDPDLRFVRVNDALAEMNGIAARDHIGLSLAELLPNLAPDVAGMIRQVHETGESVIDLELVGETPARPGEIRRWLETLYPVTAASGERIGVGAVVVEVTDRHRAQEEAAAGRERIAFLAEASSILASSLDYGETLANVARLAVPAVADWCAVDVVEADGGLRRLAVAHVDPEKVALAYEIQRRWPDPVGSGSGPAAVARTGVPELVPEITEEMLDAIPLDPERRAAVLALGLRSYLAVPLLVRGRVLGVITLIGAESGRLLGEADLALAQEVARRAAVALDNAQLFQEAEERAQAARVLDAVGDGVFLVDGHGVVRLWNPAAEQITGLDGELVLGRAATEAIPGWEGALPSVPVGEGNEPPRPEAVPLDLGHGEVWLSISGVGFADGTVYAFRDITEERNVDQLKSDFVATVSHELRTPLAAIYGASVTLQRSDLRLDADKRERLLQVIGSESERLARTINDILWASRLESDQLQLTIERCDPAELAGSVVAARAAHLPANVDLVFRSPPDIPAIRADADKLRQVLTNLVDNAVKYSPDGGRVEVRLERSDGHVRFTVEDEGLGIPPPEQERIFEKFYRLDPQLTRGVGGTGLGLYISRELVRRMHGTISVRPTVPRGSTFVVELPAA
jgi:PAS domain S-box-containing protein